MLPYDDRVEVPEGFTRNVRDDHPILAGLPHEFPCCWVSMKSIEIRREHRAIGACAMNLAGIRCSLWGSGQGRTLAWTSDIGHIGCLKLSPRGTAMRLWQQALAWRRRTMKKQGILNPQLSRAIAELGHTDALVIADAGANSSKR
jgi:uncharacterized membrane protein